MFLSITYTQKPATDLGFLLFKNPSRPQTFELSFGSAHVFYPEVSEVRCTAVLMLDIDPIDLVRGKRSSYGSEGLFDYVNDRPYVCSSFLSVAIARVFGTALSGRCDKRPELVNKPLLLTAKLSMLPCRGGEEIVRRLFEPLGYKVETQGYALDDTFPEWGKSRYYTVSLSAEVLLKDLLNHIYVLIPVLDSEKHYWIGEDEIEKLLRHGEGWLANHPERAMITNRYLGRLRRFVNRAFDRLTEQEKASEPLEDLNEADKAIELSLNQQRLGTVLAALKSANAKRVLDIGCGEGKLLELLLKDKSFERISGTDVSYGVLERAKERLKLDRLPVQQKDRVTLFHGSLTYRDKRFSGYDAISVMEVIEHLDEDRLSSLEKVLFQYAKPKTLILTTPNRDYNALYKEMPEGSLRHNDHRFEWTREQFSVWADGISEKYGYKVKIEQIGPIDPKLGAPTQMGVFTL